MKCPNCGGDALQPQYRLRRPTPILDGLTPQEPQQELAALVCDLCGECWYALHGETVEAACKRISKEEPRT